jgi:hypothetical protein
MEARTLVAANYFDPAADTVARVTLCDTTTTNTDMVAAAPSAASIADAVWDEAIAGHAGVGSTGEQLAAAGAAGDPWATAIPGAYGAGTAGKIVGDNLNAPVGSAALEATAQSILTDTAVIGAAGAGLTAVPWNAAWDAEVQSECTDALNAYDPPTNAEMEARTFAAATVAKMAASAGTIIVSAAAAGTLSTTEMTTTLTEATDDHYNGRVIIWTAGALIAQATDITDYDGATKKLTFTAVTEAPGDGDAFVIV